MGLETYRPLLRDKTTRSVLLLGLFARTPVFAGWVVITLHVVTTLDRGYAAAGLAAAAAGAAVAIGSPWRGRLLDQLGLRRAIVPSLVINAACWAVAPFLGYWPFVVLSAIAGFFLVPVFAVIRMAVVASVDTSQRRAAISLDSVFTEVSYMVGPLLGAWAAVTWDTRWVLVVLQFCAIGGGVLMWLMNPALSRDDEQPEKPSGRSWVSPALMAVYFCAFSAVIVLQATELGIIAVLQDGGADSFIGVALAFWGFGSLVGGLAYGAMSSRPPLWLLLATLAAVTAPAAMADNRWTLAGLVLLAGMLCAPAMTAMIDAIYSLVPRRAIGEAMGWHVSAITVGSALGAPVTGVFIDWVGPQSAFVLAAAVGLVAAVPIALVKRPPQMSVL